MNKSSNSAACKPKAVSDLITVKNDSALGNMLKKVQLHTHLESLVKKYFLKSSPKLPDQICVANYRDNCLILGVKKSSFAMEVNYQKEGLLAALKQKIPSLKNIEVIVLVD